MSWLAPVIEALDARGDDPCTVWFRDDDAGWDDDRLMALLDVFERSGVPVDVAVIPAEITDGLSAALLPRARRGAIWLHQHGFAHVNHETQGRKCEFGPARSYAEQAADIVAGRDLLTEHLGDLVDPVFTPPWNRCTSDTAAAVAAAGLQVLSRDATATPLGEHTLAQVPVQVDWFGQRKGVRWTREQLGQLIADRLLADDPVGVMLHHAVTDRDELARVEELVSLFSSHPGARPVRLMDVALGEPRRPSSGSVD